MKGLKKKIVIALLAATCLTAGAFGLSACTGNKSGNDSTLYAIYLSETDNGKTQTYQQWLENKLSASSDGQTPYIGANGNWWIGNTDTGVKAQGGANGDNGRGIESIKTIDGELVVFYTDGTFEFVEEADDLPFTLLKVTCKDQINAPVADVYLNLSYYNPKTYTNVVVGTFNTNAKGEATFIYEPEDGKDYRVSLAEYGKTEYTPACPEGYAVNYPIDEKYGWPISYFDVEKNNGVLQTVSIPFVDNSHSFINASMHNKIVEVPYSRVYSETAAGNAVETNGTTGNAFTVNVKSGYHTYLAFSSYVKPETSENKEETQILLNQARAAATGVYKFTISGGSNPVLYYYEGSAGNMPADERGIPKFIISHTGSQENADDEVFTDTNYIIINSDSTLAPGTMYFGLYSESDCTVTLTVERTGDATEIPDPELVPVPAPTGVSKWAAGASGEKLTLMPVTGAYTAVKNTTDGYYHVNNENGPVLVVMLTKAVSRYLPETSLQKYPEASDLGESVMYFNPSDINEYFNKDQRYPLKKYDYNQVLAAYCSQVNTDGVYGVDDNLYAILTNLAKMGVGIEYAGAANGSQWLLPCYYYEPAGGIPAPGAGTAAEPYLLNIGANSVSMNGLGGSAQIELSVSSAGVYCFETSANLAVSGCTTTTVNGKLYVLVNETDGVKLTLTGGANSYKVTVSEGSSIKAFMGSGAAGDEPSKGISAATAINVPGTGVWSVADDKSVNDGVYIKFSCFYLNDGKYTIALYGDDGATLTYGSTTASSVTINAQFGTDYGIYIKASSTANLMLVITKEA